MTVIKDIREKYIESLLEIRNMRNERYMVGPEIDNNYGLKPDEAPIKFSESKLFTNN